MDLDKAVTAHQQWKMRLKMYVSGNSEEKLDPGVIGKDDQCELGKWIHGEGRSQLGTLLEFGGLKDSHAVFHQTAAEVVRKTQAGDIPGAKGVLNGDFFKRSSEVILAITRLRSASGK
jgi:hypothetical protein